MAISAGNSITAADINAVKNRVITECNRRGVSTTAGTTSQNASATAAFINTIINPLNTINSDKTGVSARSAGQLIQPFSITTALTTFEGSPKVGTASNCKSGCTGLCQGCSGTCTGGCSSCSGSCTGCRGGCSGCGGCGSFDPCAGNGSSCAAFGSG